MRRKINANVSPRHERNGNIDHKNLFVYFESMT